MATSSTERKADAAGNVAPAALERIREAAHDLEAIRQGHLAAADAAGLPTHPAMDRLAAISDELQAVAARTAP